eukprot:s1381_g21.t1
MFSKSDTAHTPCVATPAMSRAEADESLGLDVVEVPAEIRLASTLLPRIGTPSLSSHVFQWKQSQSQGLVGISSLPGRGGSSGFPSPSPSRQGPLGVPDLRASCPAGKPHLELDRPMTSAPAAERKSAIQAGRTAAIIEDNLRSRLENHPKRVSEEVRHPNSSIAEPCSPVLETAMPPSRNGRGENAEDVAPEPAPEPWSTRAERAMGSFSALKKKGRVDDLQTSLLEEVLKSYFLANDTRIPTIRNSEDWLTFPLAVREAAREEHLKDKQAKAKCKRKRGKQTPKDDTPANPPSPQRDVKKVKGPDDKAEAEVSKPVGGPAGASAGVAGVPVPGGDSAEGQDKPDENQKPKSKTKKADTEKVQAAWVEKE